MTLPHKPILAVASISGGKDSGATAQLAIDKYGRANVRLVHAETGNEHELVEDFVRHDVPEFFGIPVDIVQADFTSDFARKAKYVAEHWGADGVSADHVSEALEILAQPTGVPFLDLCIMKGRFPSRKAQFCTQELKRRPLDAYMLDRMAEGYACESWQGVRRDESLARKDVLDGEWTPEGWWIERPISGWTAEEVISFSQRRGIPLNPLYRLGCHRVGCMLCINAGKDEIANAAKRGFSTFYNSKAISDDETDAEIFERMRIDQAVSWAKTSRGGKQFDMLRSLEVRGCSSSYGLCE